MISEFADRQFLAFLLASGLAALVNFGSRLLFDRWTGFTTAVVLAYIVGMITAFTLNRLLVFKASRHTTLQSAMIFVLVNVAAVIQTVVISVVLARYALPAIGIEAHAEEIAHAVGIMVPAFTSYLGHKYFTFAQGGELDGAG